MVFMLAAAAAREETCALADAGDAFDPASAHAAGLDLSRLLWVRCGGNPEHALKAADLLVEAGGFGLVALDLGDVAAAVARRIPMAAWYRLRRAIENTPTILLLVEREQTVKSCAARRAVPGGVGGDVGPHRTRGVNYVYGDPWGGARPIVSCTADFSPYVEETSRATAVISIDGLVRRIAEAIARRAAERDLAVNVAVAANPDLAVHGARGFPGVTVMEPGREAGLPIALLDAPEEIALTLALWGIRTFGEFAALPADGVAERLGEEGARLHRLARGAGERPLAPANPAPPFEESLDLETPVALLEPLAFVLGRLLLCAHLESRGLAAHELKLTLALEGAAPHERTMRLPYPMRSAATFLKLLSLDLEMHPPGAPVTAVSLAAEAVNPRVVQHGLFLPLAPEPQKLELTLARIARLVGEGNAGAPVLADTHRGRRGPQALRLFRPPLAAEVAAPEGRPARLNARGVRGRVLESAGPWRTSGDWWLADAWARDEWDVALSDGALYLLCRDLRDGRWFVEGDYD